VRRPALPIDHPNPALNPDVELGPGSNVDGANT
jgi:hypothetical protein